MPTRTLIAVVALAIGAIGGAMVANTAANAWRLQRAHRHAPMHAMQHHVARLDAAARGACDAAEVEARLARLRVLAPEIGYAYAAEIRSDRAFAERYAALRATLDGAGARCKALDTTLARVKDACEACHVDYR